MDAQGFANWIQQKRVNAPVASSFVRDAQRGITQPISQMLPPPPPPRPTFDPSQGAPPGMGSMGGKPGQFGNSVPGTVGPQYGPSGQPPAKPFSPQASSGNIFEPPQREGKPGNSSQPMGVKNAPNLFGKGPSAGPAMPPGPQGRDYGAMMGDRGVAPVGQAPMRPVNIGPMGPQSRIASPMGPQPTVPPGTATRGMPNFGAAQGMPIGIGGVPIPKAGG